MATLAILGPVELRDDAGAVVALGGRKPAGVLAWLASRAPRGAGTDSLAAAIWGEDPPASARNALQVYVSGLRRALDGTGARIERAGDGYALVPGPCSLDVLAAESLAGQARALARAEPARAAALLAEAVDLWRGVPLDGLDPLPFVATAREQHEARRAALLADLAELLLRCGRPDDAASRARTLTEERPLDEAGWGLLARAHYAAGRQGDALAVLRSARRRLADELGVDPGPALRVVETGVLAQDLPDPADPVPAAPEEARPPAPLPPLPAGFTGRDDVVAAVVDLLDDGERLVTLSGLGGIGKTTVAVAVAHRLRDAGRAVTFSEVESATDADGALRRVVRDVGLPEADDPVAALAARRPDEPHVVVLDNAEQAAGLAAALDRVLDAGTRLAVVVTSRTPLDARHECTVPVGPLAVRRADGSPGPAVALFLGLARRRGGRPADAATALAICERLDGIPLAIEVTAGRTRSVPAAELARRLAADAAPGLGPDLRPGRSARHPSLAHVLSATCAALEPGAAAVLREVALVDGWVPFEVLDGRHGDAAVDAVVRTGLCTTDDDGRLRCPVPVREFVRSLDPQALAGARRDLVAATVGLAGRHCSTPGPDEQEHVAALERGLDTLTSAVALATAAGDARSVAAVLLGLQRFWLLTDRLAQARGLVERALALPGHRPVDAARLGVLAGVLATYANQPEAAGRLGPALDRAQTAGAPADRLLVGGWCCLAAARAGRAEAAPAWAAADAAAQVAARSGDPSLVALARDVRGHVAAQLGDHATALEVALQGLADARRSGALHDQYNLLGGLAEDALRMGLLDDAEHYLDEADRVAALTGATYMEDINLVLRALVALAQGRPGTAHGLALVALQSENRRQDPGLVPDALGVAAAAYTDLGRGEDAARAWGAADALYARAGLPPARIGPEVTARRGPCAAALGERFDALARIGAADPDGVVARLLAPRPHRLAVRPVPAADAG